MLGNADAVVAHLQYDFVVVAVERDQNMLRAAMPQRVVQRFLGDTIKVGRHKIVCHRDLIAASKLTVNAMDIGYFVGQFQQGGAEALRVDLYRYQTAGQEPPRLYFRIATASADLGRCNAAAGDHHLSELS